MGKHLTTHDKMEMCIMYHNLQNYSKVARHFGVAVNTVKKAWLEKDKNADMSEVVQKLKSTHNKQMEDIFSLIESRELTQAVKNAITLFNPKNLDEEYSRYGIRPLLQLVGISTDKVVTIKELQLKERQMSIREKELEIKLQELELRKHNPDAFREVYIVNDAPSGNYEERNTN